MLTDEHVALDEQEEIDLAEEVIDLARIIRPHMFVISGSSEWFVDRLGVIVKDGRSRRLWDAFSMTSRGLARDKRSWIIHKIPHVLDESAIRKLDKASLIAILDALEALVDPDRIHK